MTKKEFLKLYRGGYYNEDSGVFVNKMTKEQDDCYLKYRHQYCRAIRELFLAMKRVLERVRAEDLQELAVA
jgi:hypothetical protein